MKKGKHMRNIRAWRSVCLAAAVAVGATACGSGGDTLVASESPAAAQAPADRGPVGTLPITATGSLSWDAAPGVAANLSIEGVSMVGDPYEQVSPEIADVESRLAAAELNYRLSPETATDEDVEAVRSELEKLPRSDVTYRGVRVTSDEVPGPVFVVIAQAPLYSAEEVAVHGERSKDCEAAEVNKVRALRCGAGSTRSLAWQEGELAVFVAADDAFDGSEVDEKAAAAFERLVDSVAANLTLERR